MKRWTRRVIAIALGLSLGWYAAGLVDRTTLADDRPHRHDPVSPTVPGDGHGHDPGQIAAGLLVPRDADEPATPGWYRPVVLGMVGLFVAAVVLGIPALRLKTPEPPDPADSHGHGH